MGKYETGLVSVVMPTYKRSEKLTRAIESVLNQTYRDLELLLVNDNEPSDEYTQELIKRIEPYKDDKRLCLIMQEKHINGAVARNVGIKQARGEYIAFLDDDDWWEKEKIERQIDVLKTLDSTWGGVSCKFTLYNQEGKVIGKSPKYQDGYIYKDILYLLSDVATGTLLLRRECLDEAKYFDEKLLRHQDLQLLVDFTVKYKLMEVDEFLHCVDVSDTQNRPDPEKLIRYKKAFFESIVPVMKTLSPSERRCVMALHRFELGYVYVKNKEICKGIRECLCVFSSPRALILSLKKTTFKIKQLAKIH